MRHEKISKNDIAGKQQRIIKAAARDAYTPSEQTVKICKPVDGLPNSIKQSIGESRYNNYMLIADSELNIPSPLCLREARRLVKAENVEIGGSLPSSALTPILASKLADAVTPVPVPGIKWAMPSACLSTESRKQMIEEIRKGQKNYEKNSKTRVQGKKSMEDVFQKVNQGWN